MNSRYASVFLAALVICSMTAFPALAHGESGYGGGFIAGFTHPILGWVRHLNGV